MNNAWSRFGGSRVSELLRRSRHGFKRTLPTTPSPNGVTGLARPAAGPSSSRSMNDQQGSSAAVAELSGAPDVEMADPMKRQPHQPPLILRLRQTTPYSRQAVAESPSTLDDHDSFQEVPLKTGRRNPDGRFSQRKPTPRNISDVFPVRIACGKCARTYANTKTLERHEQTVHAAEVPEMICFNCHKQFVNKKWFVSHMRVKRCKKTGVDRSRVQSKRSAASAPASHPISHPVAKRHWSTNPIYKSPVQETPSFREASVISSDSDSGTVEYLVPKHELTSPRPDSMGPRTMCMSPRPFLSPMSPRPSSMSPRPCSSAGPKKPLTEPAGVYIKLFDCYFCGDELTPSVAKTEPSHADAMDHYKASPDCFWKCLRSNNADNADRSVSKVEYNNFLDAGLILEYRRCTVCQKAFTNEALALVRHAASHGLPQRGHKVA